MLMLYLDQKIIRLQKLNSDGRILSDLQDRQIYPVGNEPLKLGEVLMTAYWLSPLVV